MLFPFNLLVPRYPFTPPTVWKVQFFQLGIRRHSPTVAPDDMGGVVRKVKYDLIIDSGIIVASVVLGQRSNAAITPQICGCVVRALRARLAPSKVVAISLGSIRAHIACRPFHAKA